MEEFEFVFRSKSPKDRMSYLIEMLTTNKLGACAVSDLLDCIKSCSMFDDERARLDFLSNLNRLRSTTEDLHKQISHNASSTDPEVQKMVLHHRIKVQLLAEQEIELKLRERERLDSVDKKQRDERWVKEKDTESGSTKIDAKHTHPVKDENDSAKKTPPIPDTKADTETTKANTEAISTDDLPVVSAVASVSASVSVGAATPTPLGPSVAQLMADNAKLAVDNASLKAVITASEQLRQVSHCAHEATKIELESKKKELCEMTHRCAGLVIAMKTVESEREDLVKTIARYGNFAVKTIAQYGNFADQKLAIAERDALASKLAKIKEIIFRD